MSLLFCALAALCAPALAAAGSQSAVVSIYDTTPPVYSVPPTYISYNFDWHLDSEEVPAWINASVVNIDISSPRLLRLVGGLAPAFLRVGGSEEDKATYLIGPNPPPCTEFCLTEQRWIDLLTFCNKAGIRMIFGLNGMNGRKTKTTPCDLTNDIELLKFTASLGPELSSALAGVELGNELSTLADPVVLGKDFIRLRQVLNEIWPDAKTRPMLIGNDQNIEKTFMTGFLKTCGSVLDAVTYHMYTGYGLDPDLPNQIMTTKFLDQALADAKSSVIPLWQQYAKQAQLWVGETAAAWHSGQENTTNAFISGFWWTEQLASLATVGVTAQCRQTLIGGWYEFLNKTTFDPNPDYWTAAIWRKVIKGGVLSASTTTGMVRAHAFCANGKPGAVALVLANIDKQNSYTVTFNSAGIKTIVPRHEWHLTAKGGDIRSNGILLNGQQLVAGIDGSLPSLEGMEATSGVSVTLEPASYGFVVFDDAASPACQA